MKRYQTFSTESVVQLLSLAVVIIVVHAVYVGVVRPNAAAVLAARSAQLQLDPSQTFERSAWVVVRDLEQEICFILFLWAVAIMACKAAAVLRQRDLLAMQLIPLSAGQRILPEDTRDLSRRIEELPAARRRGLVPRALAAALQRFGATGNIQDVSSAIGSYCEAESERLESELAMVRYIAWAIPSVGFIGTVRGIGQALGRAHEAVRGDIFGVTSSLGVAFNSTFIALVISIFLMFLVHQLQLLQERYVLDARAYCEENLTRHLHTRGMANAGGAGGAGAWK